MPGPHRLGGLLRVEDVRGAMRTAGTWTTGTAYPRGSVVTHSGGTYAATSDVPAADTFDPARWQQLSAAAAAGGSALKLVRVTTDAATDVPFRVTGADAQAANMLEVLNNAGAARFIVGPAGHATIATGNTAAVPLTLNALTGATADLQQWQIDGTTRASLNAAGVLTSRGVLAASTDPAAVPLIVRAAPTHTAGVQQWQDSTGTLLGYVTVSGHLHARRGTFTATTDVVPLTARAGTPTAVSDLQQWQANDATVTARVTSTGAFRPAQFTTTARPSAATAGAGAIIFDTTLGVPLFSNGTDWRTAAGNPPGTSGGQFARTAAFLTAR